MPELSTENLDVRKLARAYVALALAQDEVGRYADKHAAQTGFLTILTSLDITAGLLEEVLERVMPEPEPAQYQSVMYLNSLM